MDVHASFDAPERLLAESEWLARLARSLVATADDADDLAQDTFAAALAHPPDPERPLRPWLARVAHNLAVRRGLGRARREDREERVARHVALASTADVVARVAMQRTVVEAVLALDEPYRATLLLRYWDDLAPREIAERTRVPVETVRTRLKRAVAQLRERLDRRHGGRDEWLSVLLPIALTRAPAVTATATSAGLGSIGALLASISLKVGVAAVVIVLSVVVVREFVGTSASRTTAPQHASAALDVAEAKDRPTPVDGVDAESGGRKEVTAADSARSPAKTLDRQITCTVLDALTNAPIAGAHVELRMLVDRTLQTLASAETEADGVARLLDTRPLNDRNDYAATAVEVRAANYASFSTSVSSMNGINGRPGASGVTAFLWRGAQVQGHVVAADRERRVVGASLRPTLDPALLEEDKLGGAPEAAVSDARGEFALDRRLAPRTNQPTTLYALADEGIGWTTLGIIAGVEELRDVEVRVRPNAVLIVKVTDSQGTPVPTCTVFAHPMFAPFGESYYHNYQAGLGGDPRVLERFQARTDANGVARMPPLVVDDDPVHALDGTNYLITAQSSARGAATRDVRLDPDRTTELAVAFDADEGFTLHGTISELGVGPLAGVAVTSSDSQADRSDEQGRYSMNMHVPNSRTVHVFCEMPGFLPRDMALTIAPGESERSLDVELVRGARIEGVVVDEIGRPLAGFEPRLGSGQGIASEPWMTLSDGKFVFVGAEPRAAPLVISGRTDRAQWDGPFETIVSPSDSPITLRFRHRAAGRVSLDVELVDATTREHVAATNAWLYSFGDRLSRQGHGPKVERTLGHVRASGLDRGSWQFAVVTASGARAARTIDLAQDDGELALRVEVGAPGRIVGRVVFDDAPQEQWPEFASLIVDPTDEGQWIPGAGQEPELGTRGYAPLRESEGYVFRLDDVRAFDPVVLTLDSKPFYGRVKVSVPAAGEAQVELHAKLGGELVLVRGDVLKTWTAALTLRCEGESQPREDMLLISDEQLDIRSFSVPAGRVSWTIRYWSPASHDQPSVIEGEAQIAPGATLRAPIRF